MKTLLKILFVTIIVLLIELECVGLIGFAKGLYSELGCAHIKWIVIMLCTDAVMLTVIGVYIGKYLENMYED